MTLSYYIQPGVCMLCWPNHDAEVRQTSAHLLEEKGGWKGGYTQEKWNEYAAIRENLTAPRRQPCFRYEDDYSGITLCKKHFLEIAEEIK